ncbi:MAG: response regulator transcription factor [Aureliella sp.]
MPLKLLISDDHPIIGAGFAQMFAGSDVEVAGLADDVESTLTMCKTLAPELVLLDVRLGRDNGFTVLQQLSTWSSPPNVVMMSGHEQHPTYVAMAAAYGASDFLLKTDSRDAFIHSLTNAALGVSPPPSSRLAIIRRALALPSDEAKLAPLTRRETQILVHVALGLRNKDIVASLDIALETTKVHVQNLLQKLEVNDRTAAALIAVRRGLLDEIDSVAAAANISGSRLGQK